MSPAGHGDDRLVRTYVITGGRSHACRNTLDHITLVTLSPSSGTLSHARLNPEQLRILAGLAGGSQSVAELGALLELPVSVLRILLADLMESGHITTRQRITAPATAKTRELLEDVLAGLQSL
ncbi:DUF742 domain-containing protein [Streptomyces sp. NBC_00820]|uniref:DUF742 domain-containing protein n=1 Tax=Streptomyces sp. NBC_00820 TaxID=2975842 RepID=UPI002ED58CAF|nr:DUF742 domain-containing protein [Streptomyces sp. NBC_00820]